MARTVAIATGSLHPSTTDRIHPQCPCSLLALLGRFWCSTVTSRTDKAHKEKIQSASSPSCRHQLTPTKGTLCPCSLTKNSGDLHNITFAQSRTRTLHTHAFQKRQITLDSKLACVRATSIGLDACSSSSSSRSRPSWLTLREPGGESSQSTRLVFVNRS